ncbi:YitT family protein [Neobacillus sp. LXY-1]|uniref:YitT family protein n=1 Tax=Neobacillus sp. LXY-1 TaxID=3379133 RepID=UPI003EE3656E
MLRKLAVIGFGSSMIGMGINGFILPFHLINGGFFGISLLANYLVGVKVGVTFILLNIPVYLFAYKVEPSYFLNGLLGAIISGIMIDLWIPLNGVVHLPLQTSVIIGAIMIGMGVGVMLRHHISPGGMDLLALLIAKWSKWNVGVIALIMDAIIILTGLFLLHDPRLLYSLLIVTIVGFMISIITSFREIKWF